MGAHETAGGGRLKRLMAIASLTLLGADAPLQKQIDETRAELMKVEVAIEEARAHVPLTGDRAAVEAALKTAAKEVGLTDMQIEFAPAALSSKDAVELRRVDVSGRDSWQKLQRFLHEMTFFGTTGIEDLRMDAAPGGTVRFSAHILYPVITPLSTPTLDRKPVTTRDDVSRLILDTETDALQRRRATLAAFKKTVETINAANLVNALAAVADAVDAWALAMTQVRAGATTTFTGVALGARNVDALRSALKASGFDLLSLDVKPAARCSAFVASAKLTNKEQKGEVVLDNGFFDDAATSICREAPSTAADVVVHGRDANGITLRLRNADVGTIFNALHDVSAENFVVDASIDRRFNVTSENASVAAILEQLRRAGLTISNGHVHRVSSAATAKEFSAQTWQGAPVTLLLHDSLFADVMCLFHEITEMDLRMRREENPRVTVFMTDVPWDEAMANIIATAGQRYQVEKITIYISAKQALDRTALDACKIAHMLPEGRPWASHSMKMDDVGAGDLTLAGIAGASGEWKAYAFGPLQKTFILARSARLYDATVQSVGPEAVTLKTDAGPTIELRFH